MSAAPLISVVLASHNGAATLPLTLAALRDVVLPEGGVEIIAVDNASSDQTRDLLEAAREVLPLVVVCEPRQGKSFALNRALESVRGDLVVFTDDDVLPVPGWLQAYAAGAAAWPEVELFAGQVRHHWQKKPPRWLLRLAAEGRSYAGTPIGQLEGPVPASFVKGANLAVRRHVLEALRFEERAGVNFCGSTVSGGGEDTAFVRTALSRGHQLRYLQAACVKHIVRPHQVGLRPVFQRYFRIGRSMTLHDPEQFDRQGARIWGYPRYLYRTLPLEGLQALGQWLTGNSYAAANTMIGIAMTCGRASQWRASRTGPQQEKLT
jgi:glycosyltransferase involved in cell wall biosynthesis